MSEIATLLQAVASLLWPLFAFTVLVVFKKQLQDLLARLKKAKMLGQEIELGASLESLQAATAKAVEEVAASFLHVPPSSKTAAEATKEDDLASKILSEAAVSPKAALITLAAELERLTVEILATTGGLEGRRFVPFKQAISELNRRHGMAKHVQSSLEHFMTVRNLLVHRGEGTEQEILRAIDSGIALLRALQAIPRETRSVLVPHVPLFSDEALMQPLKGIHGVLLEFRAPGGTSKANILFPTRLDHYARGKVVSSEFNMTRIIDTAWYRDPFDGSTKKAWLQSAEFIGRHVDNL